MAYNRQTGIRYFNFLPAMIIIKKATAKALEACPE
jgi:hypothetical protein